MEKIGAQVLVRNADADLQGLSVGEANDLDGQSLAKGLLTPADQLLEYGFVARTDTGRSIAVGAKGRVTLAFKMPASRESESDSPRLTMTVMLVDFSTTRVTRSQAETTANAIARAPSGTSEIALLGTDDTVAGFNKVWLPNIKTTFNPALEPSRDAWLVPFHRASIWNLPLGQDAQITDVGAIAEPLSGFGSDNELHFKLKLSDPLRTLYDPGSWTNRCSGTGQQDGAFSLRLPDDLLVADATAVPFSTPNNVAALLQPDGRSVVEIEPFTRCLKAGPAYGYRNTAHPSADISNDGGAYGTHFGSGLSGYGGSIRYNELTSSQPIRHALHFNVWGAKYLYYNASDPTPGYRFPADRADSGAADPGGFNGYHGTNPRIEMGALLAIPNGVTASSLGLVTPAGKKLFAALQNYGAYITDNTGWDHNDFGLAEDAYKQFEEVSGYSFAQDASATGVAKDWYNDVIKLIKAMGVVNDNAAGNLGGAGLRRGPLAAYRFSSPDTTAPSVPGGLSATGRTPASVSLSWSASGGGDLMRYEILDATSSVVARTWGKTGVTVSNLTPSTAYSFRVRAVDSNQNTSGISGALSASTSAGYAVNFNANLVPVGWSLSPSSSVAGGVLGVGNWDGSQYARFEERVTTGSYNLDADFQCVGTGASNTTDFYFNSQDANNTYLVRSYGDNRLELQLVVNGSRTVLASATGSIKAGSTHYRLEYAAGGSITFKLNGTALLSATNTTFTGGNFGFGSDYCKSVADNVVVEGALEFPRFFSSNFDSGAPGWTLSAQSSAGTPNDYGRLTTGQYGVSSSSLHDGPIAQDYSYLFDWFTYAGGATNIVRVLFNATDETHGYALEISGTGVTKLLKLEGASSSELASFVGTYSIVGDANKARFRIVYNASSKRIIVQAERGGVFTSLFDVSDATYTGSKLGFSASYSQGLSDNVIVKPGLDVLVSGGFSSNFDSGNAPGWTLGSGSVVQYGRMDVGNFGALQTALHAKDTAGKYDFSFDLFTYASDEQYNYLYAYFDYSDTDNTYVLELTAGVNNHVRLLKRIAGVETVLGSYDPNHYSVSHSIATPRLTISRNGSSITVSAVRGATSTTLFNVTDSSLSGTNVGFGALYSVANLDNVVVVPQP